MTDAVIVSRGRAAVTVGAALAIGGSVFSIASGEVGFWWSSYSTTITLFTVVFAVLVWRVLPGQPHNRAVWAMATTAMSGLQVAGYSVLPLLSDAPSSSLRYPDYLPVEHPATVAAILSVAEVASTIGVFAVLTFGLLLFPDGTLPSRRWRPVAWLAGMSIAMMCLSYVWELRPSNAGRPEDGVLGNLGLTIAGVVVLAALVALVRRFRRASGLTRQQYKWVFWGAGCFLVSFLAAIALEPVAGSDGLLIGSSIGLVVLTAAYGVAIGRYRLYDVDLVISRTIVYVSLAAIITAVYVGAVVGVGAALGSGNEPNTALAITTTTAVAAAFQPLRRRLQQLADRVVYGRRATPHDVLSKFAERVAANDDHLVELVARSMVDGTGANRAELWVSAQGRLVRTASWPDGDEAKPLGDAVKFPINLHGAELGLLKLWLPSGQRLAEQDRALVEQVVSGMALALRNRTLTVTLERRVVELRQSRRRLVAVQDEVRRRLERDLHDGAQQQLVALRVKLGLARSIADKDGAVRTVAALHRLTEDADRVVENMRDFARGVYPPLLEAEGLGPALATQARRAPIPVAVRADGLSRYDRDVESTIHVCVVEALLNVSRHASARSASVTVTEVGSALAFEVNDDGIGFDVGMTPRGAGLTNLADRCAALGGGFSVSSAPGEGTAVTGSVPLVATPREASDPETAKSKVVHRAGAR